MMYGCTVMAWGGQTDRIGNKKRWGYPNYKEYIAAIYSANQEQQIMHLLLSFRLKTM